MSVKTERITILGTPDFKAFLTREAKKEGVSLSHLVRERCRQKPSDNKDEELLLMLVSEVVAATAKAKISLEKGLEDVEKVLTEIRRAA